MKRESYADASSNHREHEALGKARADELGAARAESGAHSGFALRIDGAGELQIGKIDAGDEQHGKDSRKKQPKRCTDG